MDEGTETIWTEGLQGESFTPEVKESLSAKFKGVEDLATNYLDLEKQVRGKPFRLPESLDKLPDDKTRGEFKASVGKLLGAVEKPEDLKDVKWTVGMAEGAKPDEGLVKGLTEFAIANKWSKDQIQQGVGFWNNAISQAVQQQQAQAKERADSAQKELVAALGSPDKVTEQSELVKRFFQNRPGMTPEKFEKIGLELSQFVTNPTLVLELISIAKQMQGEGTTEAGKGGDKPIVDERSWGEKEGLPKTDKALWPNGVK